MPIVITEDIAPGSESPKAAAASAPAGRIVSMARSVSKKINQKSKMNGGGVRRLQARKVALTRSGRRVVVPSAASSSSPSASDPGTNRAGDGTGCDVLNSTAHRERDIFRFLHECSDEGGKSENSDTKTSPPTVPKQSVVDLLESTGLRFDSPLMKPALELLDSVQGDVLTAEQFIKFARHKSMLATKALMDNLVVPDFPSFCDVIDDIYAKVEPCDSGKVADYIPQLGRVDPNQFGIAVCTIDGQRYGVGDYQTPFCIQSCSKPITYGLAQEEAIQSFGGDVQKGVDWVHQHVGCEPSGKGFNERILNPKNLPHNPFLNSGSIMCASLVKRDDTIADRFDYLLDRWEELSGRIGPVEFSNSTYLSEKATSDRNCCLGYMMQEEGAFPPGTDLMTTIDFYYMLCALEMTAEQLSIVAATLANSGINPLTGARLFNETVVRNILSISASCGLYDWSGGFAFQMGVPAKSCASGCIFIVIPNKMGFATFSPNLDENGNSVRGVAVCRELVNRFSFHQYDDLTRGSHYANKVDPTQSQEQEDHSFEYFLWACARGDMMRLRHLFARGEVGREVSAGDYDARTGLHLAAGNGHAETVRFLLLHGANPETADRFGNAPVDEAKKGGFNDCVELLEKPPAAVYRAREGNDAWEATIFGIIEQIGSGRVDICVVKEILKAEGFGNESSPHVKDLYAELRSARSLDDESLAELLNKFPVLKAAICGEQVLQDFGGSFSTIMQEIYDTVEPNHGGANADYIPALAAADPEKFGISVCSLTGQQFDIGDSNVRFGMQSMTKVINYCIAQTELGVDKVHQHVGQEPSGQLFNEICLDADNLPHNPCINAGAIMTCSLIKPDLPVADRLAFIENVWTDLTGGKKPTLNSSMFLGERATADRNFCLAYYMKGAGAFPSWVRSGDDLNTILELYFMTCSLEITSRQMAVVAATLANGGTNPLTNKRIFAPDVVRNALAIMASCGMYNSSGQYAFDIGLPCKSGVGGGLMIVVPGIMGIATFSPRLDRNGNSVRGCHTCVELTRRFNLHVYDESVRDKLDPTVYGGTKTDINTILLNDAAAENDIPSMKYLVLGMGVDPNMGDYDSRTPLHLAAENGKKDAVKFLLIQGANRHSLDRWGKTPVDCVKHDDVATKALFDKPDILSLSS